MEKAHLTMSCGIAANKMLSKICSNINKPNGQYFLERDRNKIMEFMCSLSVRELPGIGGHSENILKGLGIDSCAQILENAYKLKIGYSQSSLEFFL